jgi:hypothetical protein
MSPYDLMDVKHHFGGGMYMKECHLRPGYRYDQHRHSFDHLSVLVSGEANIEVDGIVTSYTAPAVIKITARKIHSVTPLTEVVWLCCHATDEVAIENIDEELIDVA